MSAIDPVVDRGSDGRAAPAEMDEQCPFSGD
jgi:hypothetical protein